MAQMLEMERMGIMSKLTKEQRAFWDTLKFSYDKSDILRTNPQILKHIIISKQIGKITEPLAECIVYIANRYVNKPQFHSFTYKGDMVSYAILMAYKNILTFKPEKSDNPYAYIVTMVNGACHHIIGKEHREAGIKKDMLEEAKQLAEDNVRN